jgi:hypothetical protein
MAAAFATLLEIAMNLEREQVLGAAAYLWKSLAEVRLTRRKEHSHGSRGFVWNKLGSVFNVGVKNVCQVIHIVGGCKAVAVFEVKAKAATRDNEVADRTFDLAVRVARSTERASEGLRWQSEVRFGEWGPGP